MLQQDDENDGNLRFEKLAMTQVVNPMLLSSDDMPVCQSGLEDRR